MPATDVFTRREYDLLPEGFPAELVSGALVRQPSVRYGHGVVVSRLLAALLARLPPERVHAAPVDVVIDEWNVHQPDVCVLARAPRFHERATETPVVVFEVLSPSTRRRDAGVKRANYLRAGVAEVWLVDPDEKTVERHSAREVVRGSGGEALRSEVVPGFEVVPEALFAEPPAR
jgi:Uma2 family endonuclease